MLDETARKEILVFQSNELYEHFIYSRLAEHISDRKNKKVLKRISDDELKHYNFWKRYSKVEMKPNWLKIMLYYCVFRVLGITFALKKMHNLERKAQKKYRDISQKIPATRSIIRDEERHERHLMAALDEDRLHYTGAIVVGLNDALVKLIAVLAGFTFALKSTFMIGLAGLFVGIIYGLSTAASEFLEIESEEEEGKTALKGALYSFLSYMLTSILLLLPFFIFKDAYLALGMALLVAFLVILFFSFYISIIKDISFKRRALQMVIVCLGIAMFSFGMAFLLKKSLGLYV